MWQVILISFLANTFWGNPYVAKICVLMVSICVGWGPEGWEEPNFSLFSLSHHHFTLFCVSLVSSRGILVVCEAPGLENTKRAKIWVVRRKGVRERVVRCKVVQTNNHTKNNQPQPQQMTKTTPPTEHELSL